MSALYTRAFGGITLAHLLLAMPTLSQFPVLSWQVTEQLGGDKVAFGQVLSAALLGAMLARPLAGGLLDRLGRRPVLLVSGLLCAAVYPAYATCTEVGPLLIGLRLVHGLGFGALFPALVTYAADVSPPMRRAEGLAAFGSVGLLGLALGPSLGLPLVRATSFFGWCVAAGLATLAGTLVAVACPVSFTPRPDARIGFFSGLMGPFFGRRLVGLWVVTVLWGIVMGSAMCFVEPLCRERGLPFVRDFYLPYGLIAVALRLGGGRLLDLHSPLRLLMPALAVQSVGLIVLALATRRADLWVAGGLCGLGHGFAFPILNALAIKRSPPGEVGAAVGAFITAIDLGQLVFNPLGGWIAEHHGFATMFGVVLAIQLVAGAVFVADERRLATASP